MRTRRKLMIGLTSLAVAAPLGMVGAIEGPTLLAWAKAPVYPVMCNIGATVSFSPPLQAGGITGPNEPNEVSTVSNITLSHCLSSNGIGAPSSGTAAPLSITTPPAKAGKVNGVKQFSTGNCATFTSAATLKSLKGLTLTISWSGESGTGQTIVTTKGKAGVAVSAGAEVGFVLSGPATGDYPYKFSETVAYVLFDANGINLLSGCPNGPVSSITIDSSVSTVLI